MEVNFTVLSAPEYMHIMESLVMQENQEDVENMDLEDYLENLVMMPSAILGNTVKTVNLEGPEILEKMVHLENQAMMVGLEMMLI